jgi:hypothetical protein
MAAARRPGDHNKHVITAPWIRVNGSRAFSRCHANLVTRNTLDGHQLDLEAWIRFFDLLERRDGVWRIAKRTAVYDKDRLTPVDPRGIPGDFFAGMHLSAYPEAVKFLCYVIQRRGGSPRTDLVTAFSAAERALAEEGEQWLAGG